ncbi:THUMP domain-containing protein [Geomonas sp. RF6]|uniref:THUMP domain-containing protein n=1 Tax=Geomonas sp. RF6 TaxID=2897342 RepID=UPI001E5E7918|nr:THUMP domain-containing protein [Geomonas sp. RF6]UFS70152.1 THUMP domain-containing protein [Geomonas sp. RF6]
MNDWNVVVTVYEGGYNHARRVLEPYGPVAKSDFFNVLLMRVEDPRRLLDAITEEAAREPAKLHAIARLMPVLQTFTFQSPMDFEQKARNAVTAWLPSLEGKRFHLRMHRRGFKGKLSTMDEERFLDTYLLEALQMAGMPARISFDNPDVIIALETVGPRAGLSLWTREELQRYQLLHLD